jgi:hypothetical protein
MAPIHLPANAPPIAGHETYRGPLNGDSYSLQRVRTRSGSDHFSHFKRARIRLEDKRKTNRTTGC